MDVLLAALIPPRRRAPFLLGGAVSVSMLRGDSETECLLEDVVDNGLDDDEPFFLEKRLVVFFHMVAAIFSLLNSGLQPVTRHLNSYFGMWTLSGLRWWIFGAIKLGKVGYVYGGFGHTNLNTQTKEGEGSLPAENGSRGAP
jgi:hypothetical protein